MLSLVLLLLPWQWFPQCKFSRWAVGLFSWQDKLLWPMTHNLHRSRLEECSFIADPKINNNNNKTLK